MEKFELLSALWWVMSLLGVLLLIRPDLFRPKLVFTRLQVVGLLLAGWAVVLLLALILPF